MPSIPITNIPPYIQYVASASQTAFTVPFVFFWDSVSYPNPLLVFKTPVGTTPNDVADVIALNTDYTISQALNYTGTVTLSAPATAGDIITIVRNMNNVRLNYYINGGAFTANAVNTDFESEVLYIQQNTYDVKSIAPHYNYTAAPSVPGDIILPTLQANEVWIKDPTGTFITTTSAISPPPPPPGFVEWVVVSASQPMEAGFGYIVESGTSTITLTVPSVLTVGDMFAVMLVQNGTAKVQLASGQILRVGNVTTSVAGSLSTTQIGDTMMLVATSTTGLQVLSGVTADYIYL